MNGFIVKKVIPSLWKSSPRLLSRVPSPSISVSIPADLTKANIKFKEGHNTYIVSPCPFCLDHAKNTTSVYLNKATGTWSCMPCKRKGSWDKLYNQLCMSQLSSSDKSKPRHPVSNNWSTYQMWSDVDDKTREKARSIFQIPMLTDSIIDKYGVKIADTKFSDKDGHIIILPSMVFPWYKISYEDRCAVPHFLKLEAVTDDHDSLTSLESIPIKPYGLFGWNTVSENDKELIVTDDEFNALTIHHSTGLPSVAMETNDSSSSLSSEVLSQLERFNKIYLWFGLSRRLVSVLVRSLSKPQCFIIRSKEQSQDFKSAVDAVNKGYDIKNIITQADSAVHKQMLSFHQFKGHVYSEFLNAEKIAGIKWQRFPDLTKYLKGFRQGELTIFTGPTGSGKTTLMSELSLDLCQQGVSTLWGSFEISNVRLAKTMLKQFSGQNLEVHLKNYDYWADKFQKLPIYFMGFHGSADIKNVIEVMIHAVYVHNVQHVIIDNLQFMVGATYRGFDDSFHAQNAAIFEFRKFATIHGIHVTIIVHPRKEDELKLLTTASIFGTAKASQEADNVMILQSLPRQDKFLQVTKNRFSGDLGKVPLKFDRESLTFSSIFITLKNTTKQYKKEITVKADKPSERMPSSSQGPLKPVFIEKSNDYNNLRHTPILKPAISILGKNIELTSQSKS